MLSFLVKGTPLLTFKAISVKRNSLSCSQYQSDEKRNNTLNRSSLSRRRSSSFLIASTLSSPGVAVPFALVVDFFGVFNRVRGIFGCCNASLLFAECCARLSADCYETIQNRPTASVSQMSHACAIRSCDKTGRNLRRRLINASIAKRRCRNSISTGPRAACPSPGTLVTVARLCKFIRLPAIQSTQCKCASRLQLYLWNNHARYAALNGTYNCAYASCAVDRLLPQRRRAPRLGRRNVRCNRRRLRPDRGNTRFRYRLLVPARSLDACRSKAGHAGGGRRHRHRFGGQAGCRNCRRSRTGNRYRPERRHAAKRTRAGRRETGAGPSRSHSFSRQ